MQCFCHAVRLKNAGKTDGYTSIIISEVVPFEAPLSLERPRPSDHCPHVLQLPL